MKILVSFIDKSTDKEIGNCECDTNNIDKFYKEGENIEIHGEMYNIHKTVVSINGHKLLKVFVIKTY